ncbi:hypothetical protein FUSNEC_GEN_279_02995 [Fusobacterium necrophorum subsp. funduliforme]
MWLSIENTYLLLYIWLHPCKCKEELNTKFENSSLHSLIKNKYIVQTESKVKKNDSYIGIDFFYMITPKGKRYLLVRGFLAFCILYFPLSWIIEKLFIFLNFCKESLSCLL